VGVFSEHSVYNTASLNSYPYATYGNLSAHQITGWATLNGTNAVMFVLLQNALLVLHFPLFVLFWSFIFRLCIAVNQFQIYLNYNFIWASVH